MPAAAKHPGHMTVEEFFAWDSADPLRYELVDGDAVAMAPASPMHGFLQAELGSLIRNHLRQHRPRCELIANPGVVPHLLSAHNCRIPDLAVTCLPLTLRHPTLADPVLVVEILSPSSKAHTWANVRSYTSIPSVQEILVLHSTRMAAELLRRAADGSWPAEPDFVSSGNLALASIGFAVTLAELYARTGLAE
jgi:Uma2 family endonuclease